MCFTGSIYDTEGGGAPLAERSLSTPESSGGGDTPSSATDREVATATAAAAPVTPVRRTVSFDRENRLVLGRTCPSTDDSFDLFHREDWWQLLLL